MKTRNNLRGQIKLSQWPYFTQNAAWNTLPSLPPRQSSAWENRLLGMAGSRILWVWYYRLGDDPPCFREWDGRPVNISRWAMRINLPNKYGAVTERVEVTVEGGRKEARSLNGLERARGTYLELLQRAGQISDLTYQRVIHLTNPNCPGIDIDFRSDCTYMQNGRLIVEDTKGVMGGRFAIICKLWPWFGPGDLWIVKRHAGGKWVVKVIGSKLVLP